MWLIDVDVVSESEIPIASSAQTSKKTMVKPATSAALIFGALEERKTR
jgi:hypothetical protein